MRIAQLDALLNEGLERRVFQAADAAVIHRGHLTLFRAGQPTSNSALSPRVFDLASVTKVMSTTALVCWFSSKRAISLGQSVGYFFPSAPAKHVTIADLMTHRSGLPAFVPFFDQAIRTWPQLQSGEPLEALRMQAREWVCEAVQQTAPVAPVGTAAVYSDIGFLLLGQILERIGGAPLDALFQEHLAKPLGLTLAGFQRVSETTHAHWPEVVGTQQLRPREPAPGQEGLWSVSSVTDAKVGVDDDNAWAMNGVAGHAGLFATAEEVAKFGQAILEGRFKLPEPWGVDATTPGSTRTFGFDTPSATGASCGTRLGRTPPGAIGHLGFTGTSLWVDFAQELVVVLLSNRTFYGRANIAIREFRQRFHEAVIDSLS